VPEPARALIVLFIVTLPVFVVSLVLVVTVSAEKKAAEL
jgi:hypothetical protein